MKELPMIVAQTKVGKIVNVKIWRNKKLINKKITLGRLETSEDFKETKPKLVKSARIENLKIEVRPLKKEDIINRGLPSNTTGLP